MGAEGTLASGEPSDVREPFSRRPARQDIATRIIWTTIAAGLAVSVFALLNVRGDPPRRMKPIRTYWPQLVEAAPYLRDFEVWMTRGASVVRAGDHTHIVAQGTRRAVVNVVLESSMSEDQKIVLRPCEHAFDDEHESAALLLRAQIDHQTGLLREGYRARVRRTSQGPRFEIDRIVGDDWLNVADSGPRPEGDWAPGDEIVASVRGNTVRLKRRRAGVDTLMCAAADRGPVLGRVGMWFSTRSVVGAEWFRGSEITPVGGLKDEFEGSGRLDPGNWRSEDIGSLVRVDGAVVNRPGGQLSTVLAKMPAAGDTRITATLGPQSTEGAAYLLLRAHEHKGSTHGFDGYFLKVSWDTLEIYGMKDGGEVHDGPYWILTPYYSRPGDEFEFAVTGEVLSLVHNDKLLVAEARPWTAFPSGVAGIMSQDAKSASHGWDDVRVVFDPPRAADRP